MSMFDGEDLIFAAQIGAEIPQIDLHGMYPSEALFEADMFLYKNPNAKILRIIYGGGQGILRAEILKYLRAQKIVRKLHEESDASVLVLI